MDVMTTFLAPQLATVGTWFRDLPTLAAGAEGHTVTVLLLALCLILAVARLLGDLMVRFGQPSILGELIAGILLGPTVLGFVSPDSYTWLFDGDENAKLILQGMITLSATFLLLVAGLEVELSVAIKQGKAAALVALIGMAVPFAMGFLVAWFGPWLLGMDDVPHRAPFAIFVGIALSITALPVIAKILIDLNIFKADLGMLIMSAAILNDVAGWIGFAVVMALLPVADGVTQGVVEGVAQGAEAAGGTGIGTTLLLTVGFMAFVMTIGRMLVHRVLPFIQAYGTWPGGVIGFVLVITLLCAAATEAIGIHAIFGAFLAGVAIGDSHHLRHRTRETIHEFITSIFGPIFFASIGLFVNFVEAFDLVTVLIVVIIAFSGKISGCFFAGRLAGLKKDESMAVGFGMVAQGTMGVILGQLALNLDTPLISQELFVAIVVVALLTSIAAGPGMQKMLRMKQTRKLGDILSEKQFVAWLEGRDTQQVIGELSAMAAGFTDIKQSDIYEAVWRREQIMSTGLSDGIAAPHARLAGISKPIVVIGRSKHGVDFDAADGVSARVICLLLTPLSDQVAQVELLRMVAEAFSDASRRSASLSAETYTEFLAAIKLPGEATQPVAH
jgi:Kef-type K+ transport system membrane component KefB/mannitol/fructose-specific phosphotransferase system IIA component (Ntr-type)